MKVSLIATVYNEERNLRDFLDSIVAQTRQPDEVIIVDGGSKDKTYNILKQYAKKYKLFKVFQKRGNISQGRNEAIKHSKGDIIFTGDCGTVFEKDWIKKLLGGFSKDIDIVFGTWFVDPSNLVERFLVSRSPNWDNLNLETIIPSNRCTAFRREVWERLGGFPEHLRRADDNWFHLKAHEQGFTYALVRNARVAWRLDRTFWGMVRLAFFDSKTEGFSLMFTTRKIYLAELFVLFLGLVVLFAGIFIATPILWYALFGGILGALFSGGYLPARKAKDIRLLFLGPFLQVSLYFAHVFGLLSGLVQRMYKKKED